jgi:uncharacterized protein YecE (DUF72 family)
MFQFAPWVTRSDESLNRLATLSRELPDDVIAIEFRNRSWFGDHTDETLRFLHEHDLTYVSIDGPRSRAAVPSLQRRAAEGDAPRRLASTESGGAH